jgi:hypothetical protein
LPAHVAAQQVFRHYAENDQDAEAEQVLVGRRIDGPAEQIDVRHRHRPRTRIVGKPLDAQEGPIQKNWDARVATARYKPRTRRLGMPNTMPAAAAIKPPNRIAASAGMPSMRTMKL